jgi:hypothetical protein
MASIKLLPSRWKNGPIEIGFRYGFPSAKVTYSVSSARLFMRTTKRASQLRECRTVRRRFGAALVTSFTSVATKSK